MQLAQSLPLPATPAYRLQSPFATHADYDRPVTSLHRTAAQRENLALIDHSPAKFDSRGYPVPRGKGSGIHIHKPGVYNNAAAMPVIPGKWSAEPPHAVVGDLRESRRKERIPHSSFDIDGDGIVSQLDYFYATQFDKDRDGKLNSEERAACLSAIQNGFGKQYYHVTSALARTAEHRVMQKRGHILAEEGDGWSKLHNSYLTEDLAPASEYAPFASGAVGGVADSIHADNPLRQLSTTMGMRTRSELLRGRRQKEMIELNKVGGLDAELHPIGLDVTKPFNPDADVTRTAPNRTQLLRQRRVDVVKSVLGKEGRGEEHIPTTLVEDDGERVGYVTQGLPTLSRTLSDLKWRKQQLQKREAARAAPTKPPGVHDEALPSHTAALGSTGVWYLDNSHLEGFAGTNFEGSDLDGSTRLDTMGQVKSHAGRRVNATTGQPIIAHNLDVEVSAPADPTRTKEIALGEVPVHLKKRTGYYDKVTQVVQPHWEETAKLPMRKRTDPRWSDYVISGIQAAEDKTLYLDPAGKSKVRDPTEEAPMYSSFAADRVFREPKFRVSEAQPSVSPARTRAVFGSGVTLDSFPTPSSEDRPTTVPHYMSSPIVVSSPALRRPVGAVSIAPFESGAMAVGSPPRQPEPVASLTATLSRGGSGLSPSVRTGGFQRLQTLA